MSSCIVALAPANRRGGINGSDAQVQIPQSGSTQGTIAFVGFWSFSFDFFQLLKVYTF